jgi:hypothetical protein
VVHAAELAEHLPLHARLTKMINAYEKTLKTRHSGMRGNDEFSGLMDKSGLIIALPASVLILLLPLLMAPVGLLRLPFILRSLFLALRPWWLLLALCRPLLLPLIL